MVSSPYSDLTRPPLAVQALQRALVVPGGIWRRLDVVGETGSTNADAAKAALDGVAEGLVVVAEQQVSGRGRRDRQWVSPARAGLTLSVLLRPGAAVTERDWPAAPQRTWGWLPLLAGVALREAVQRVAEVDASLKWPNDLLVKHPGTDVKEPGSNGEEPGSNGEEPGSNGAWGKAAGILAEVSGDAVVVGIGLNVSTRAEELPRTNGLPATSLLLSGAKSTDRDPLLRALLRSFGQWYSGWREAGGDAEMCGLLGACREGCTTIGREVRVLLPDGGELVGTATDVDSDGQLIVRTVSGSERRVSAGDVLHVR